MPAGCGKPGHGLGRAAGAPGMPVGMPCLPSSTASCPRVARGAPRWWHGRGAAAARLRRRRPVAGKFFFLGLSPGIVGIAWPWAGHSRWVSFGACQANATGSRGLPRAWSWACRACPQAWQAAHGLPGARAPSGQCLADGLGTRRGTLPGRAKPTPWAPPGMRAGMPCLTSSMARPPRPAWGAGWPKAWALDVGLSGTTHSADC